MTDCREIREHLPEHALGTLDEETRPVVDRHLAWCAGCRKEAAELAEGAEALGHALSPARPPDSLRDEVIRAVSRAVGEPARERSHRLRRVVAVVAATVVFSAVLGWAVAMTGQAERMEQAAATAASRAAEFEALVAEILREPGQGKVVSAELSRVDGEAVVGRAIVSDSPGGYDWALVVAGGLADGDGPYRAFLLTADGRERLGRLHPSSPGEAAGYRIFGRDLSGVKSVWITNGRGETVARGPLRER